MCWFDVQHVFRSEDFSWKNCLSRITSIQSRVGLHVQEMKSFVHMLLMSTQSLALISDFSLGRTSDVERSFLRDYFGVQLSSALVSRNLIVDWWVAERVRETVKMIYAKSIEKFCRRSSYAYVKWSDVFRLSFPFAIKTQQQLCLGLFTDHTSTQSEGKLTALHELRVKEWIFNLGPSNSNDGTPNSWQNIPVTLRDPKRANFNFLRW